MRKNPTPLRTRVCLDRLHRNVAHAPARVVAVVAAVSDYGDQPGMQRRDPIVDPAVVCRRHDGCSPGSTRCARLLQRWTERTRWIAESLKLNGETKSDNPRHVAKCRFLRRVHMRDRIRGRNLPGRQRCTRAERLGHEGAREHGPAEIQGSRCRTGMARRSANTGITATAIRPCASWSAPARLPTSRKSATSHIWLDIA